MRVDVTKLVQESFATPAELDFFVSSFTEWKSGDEFGSYYLGKDGGYVRPKLDWPGHFLRHVHLVPLVDLEQAAKWDKAWGGPEGSRGRRRGRKTSDRVLVYVERSSTQFLLIAVLGEQDGPHDIANMRTQQDREIMYAFAEVANHYIGTGEVLELG